MKVEEIDGQGKSLQQVERDLLEKDQVNKDQEAAGDEPVVEVSTEPKIDQHGVYDLTGGEDLSGDEPVMNEEPVIEDKVLTDDDVQKYLRKKFDKDDLTIDNLVRIEEKEVIKEVERELPSDVAMFLKYKEETGRSMSDYMKSTTDLSTLSDDDAISRYISLTNPEFDNDDVSFQMESEYSHDEMDDESERRAKIIKKKRILNEAKNYLAEHNEKYKAPLESGEGFISKEDRELLAKVKNNNASQKETQESNRKKQEHFSKKTNELFSDKFKGFDFNIDEKTSKSLVVTDVDKVKESQMSAMNFINSHLDENGMLKDAEKYHKAMYAAQNADELFKTAYELGAAEAIERDAKEAKNIDMGRKKPISTRKTGTTVREVSSPGSNLRADGGLRITGRRK